MGSRWLNLAVVGLWLATMTWLVKEKILPPLMIGEPPSYRTIIEARRSEPPVGWELSFDGRPIGWALSAALPLPNDLTEIRSRVHFDELPLAEITPGWLGNLLKLTEYRRAKLQMDTRSTLVIDSLGRLARFEASVRLEDIPEVVHMEGTMDEGNLKVTARCGEVTLERTAPVSSNALMGDSLSPQTKLPGLRAGQKWTVPTFSPFGRLDTRLEVLHATVKQDKEPVSWGGSTVEAWVVEFRSDPGMGLGASKKPQGKLWVLPDGTVVKQQVAILNAQMTFVRMGDEDASRLAAGVKLDEMFTPPPAADGSEAPPPPPSSKKHANPVRKEHGGD